MASKLYTYYISGSELAILEYDETKGTYISPLTDVVSGLEIDYRAYANTGLIDSSKKEVSNYDYELDKNEAKRNILLLNPEFLAVFLKEFEFLMKV